MLYPHFLQLRPPICGLYSAALRIQFVVRSSLVLTLEFDLVPHVLAVPQDRVRLLRYRLLRSRRRPLQLLLFALVESDAEEGYCDGEEEEDTD